MRGTRLAHDGFGFIAEHQRQLIAIPRAFSVPSSACPAGRSGLVAFDLARATVSATFTRFTIIYHSVNGLNSNSSNSKILKISRFAWSILKNLKGVDRSEAGVEAQPHDRAELKDLTHIDQRSTTLHK